jgi:integrase
MGIKPDPKKPGTWVAWYAKRHPITRTPVNLRRRGFKTKAEARRAERQLVIDVEDKIRRKTIPTWKDHVLSFKDHMLERGLMRKTAENYFICLKFHTFESWGSRLVDDIKTQEIRELIKSRVGNRSPSHQKNLLKFIRGAFKYALELGHVNRNLSPEMKFRVGDKIKQVLTQEQVKLFLNKAKEYAVEWYPHWCLALYTGMRNGELYALTWDKVIFENRQIIVDCSWNKEDGFKSTKSGDDRMVEIAPTLLTILKELKLESQDRTFVLPRIDKWDKGEQARELRMFLTGLGLPSIRFHDLRATWATIMLSRGIEPIKVMIQGGWKDLKTMQIYIRKAGVDIKGSTDGLELHNPRPNQGCEILKLSSNLN